MENNSQNEGDVWHEKIMAWIRDVENGHTIALNPNWEEITEELLNKILWWK